MWLKTFRAYFSPVNLPFSDDELREVTLRDYSEELKAVSDVIFRISQICTGILSEEQVSYSSFAKYIENSLKDTYRSDSSFRKLQKKRYPDRDISSLMESLLDIRTINQELSRLGRIPYLCFTSIGRMIHREIHKGAFSEYFLEKKFVALFDAVESPSIHRVVRSIEVPHYRGVLASIFLELFRVLRYLEHVAQQMQDAHALKRSLLIFSLVHSEVRLLIQFMEKEFIKNHPDPHFVQLIESITYSLSMELKKVIQKELIGAASLQQYELIFTKVQNSQGILTNALKQVVFSLAQYIHPQLKGEEVFPDYVTRLEESLKLRSDVSELHDYVKHFRREGELSELSAMVRKLDWFRSRSMRYLMYKDWGDLESFYQEVCACKSSGNLNFSLHRLETFLATLYKEVNKRAILQDHPL